MGYGDYIEKHCPLINERLEGWGVTRDMEAEVGLTLIAKGLAALGYPVPAKETPVQEYLDSGEAYLRTLHIPDGQLLPCPFCGKDNKNQIYDKPQPDGSVIAFIICDACGAVVSFRPNLSGGAALRKYNTRVTWH